MGEMPEERDKDSPAGLRNMGATCYVCPNVSLLADDIGQCVFTALVL